jgi:AraC-like DNA-binding protein
MDVISDLLGAVKLKGAFYFNGEFSAPWAVRTPESGALAPHFGQGGRLVIFHLLTQGEGVAGLENGPWLRLKPGDVVVFPRGDAHVIGNGQPLRPVDYGTELARIVSQGLRVARAGGMGETTKFVCGYLTLDAHLSRRLLEGLPPVFKVNVRGEGAGQWLENAIRYSVDQAADSPAGGDAVLARLAEALFIETLRRHIAALPEDETGWLAGARDELVARALTLLHRRPAESWTLHSLARRAGTSRSVLAERFRRYLEESPMAYLAHWRLQLAARQLLESRRSVRAIATEVGYDSEPAFNRAFRREFGMPPARYRQSETRGRAAR